MKKFYHLSVFITSIFLLSSSSLTASTVLKTTTITLAEVAGTLDGFEKDDFAFTSELLYADRENSIPETGGLNKFWAFEYKMQAPAYIGVFGSMLRITDNREDKATFPVKEIRLYGSTPTGSPVGLSCFPDAVTSIVYAKQGGVLTDNPILSESNPARFTFDPASEAYEMFSIFGNSLGATQVAYIYKIEIDYDALYSSVEEVDTNSFDVVALGNELSFSEDISSVTVYTTSGNAVSQGSNLSSLPKGLYIVKAESVSGKTLIKKIVK